MPANLFTIDYLTTQAGMVAAVMLLVFFIKWLTGWDGNKVRYVAFVWALIVVITVMFWQKAIVLVWPFTPALSMALITGILNSMFVTLLAMGAYEVKKVFSGKYPQ